MPGEARLDFPYFPRLGLSRRGKHSIASMIGKLILTDVTIKSKLLPIKGSFSLDFSLFRIYLTSSYDSIPALAILFPDQFSIAYHFIMIRQIDTLEIYAIITAGTDHAVTIKELALPVQMCIRDRSGRTYRAGSSRLSRRSDKISSGSEYLASFS